MRAAPLPECHQQGTLGSGSDSLQEFRAELLAGRCGPLDVPEPVLIWDTNDFDAISADGLGEQTAALITSHAPTA